MGWSSCARHPGQSRAGKHCCDGCDQCPDCEGWKGTRLNCDVCCGPLYACPDCLPKIRAHVLEAKQRKADEAAGQMTFIKCAHPRSRCVECGAEVAATEVAP